MGWKDSGVEILVAVIGSSLIGTSLTTIYSDIYIQPYIDIKVIEHHNPLSPSNTVDYYEILFKNTGQKYASNSQLNLFFFANITKHLTIIHNGNVTFEQSNQTFPDSVQVMPSVLSSSLNKFPKNSIILVYVWVKPWEYSSEEQQYLSNAYYVSATYDEGSNHLSSNSLQTPYRDNVGKFIPHIKEESSDFVSLNNISFITIILSILAFAILFRIRSLKHKRRKKKYEILSLIPIIFSISVFVFFAEVYLKDAIFVFFPKGLIDFTEYFMPINREILIDEGYRLSQFPFLVYGFFGVMTIWITKLFITYIICKFILKYFLNPNYNISSKMGEGENRKLFLLSTIISLPIYTIVDYFFPGKVSSYSFLILMMCLGFIELLLLFYFYRKQITGDTIVGISRKLSKIFCFFSGITYLVISFFIVRQYGDTFQVNFLGGNLLDISSIFEFNPSVAGWFIFSFLLFLIVGIIHIIWSLSTRENTKSLSTRENTRSHSTIENTQSLRFYIATAIGLTIFWLSLRIYLPFLLSAASDNQLGYPGLFGLIPLILNLGLFALTFHILNIIIDYILVKKNSIILAPEKSRLSNPKALLSILSVIIIGVLTPLILFTFVVEGTINQFTDFNNFMRPSSITYDTSGVFYVTMGNSDCFRVIYPGISECIKTKGGGSIIAMDIDPLFKKLFLLKNSGIEIWDIVNPYDITFNYSKPVDFVTGGEFSVPKLRYYNNTIFILHNNKISEIDFKTGNTTSIDLERVVDNFAINPKTKDLFIASQNGYGVLDGNKGKEISFTTLPGITNLIEYNSASGEIYVSYRDFKDNKVYIIIIKSNEIIKKFETNGFPLKIGVNNITEMGTVPKYVRECNPPLTVFMHQPDGIAKYSYGSCSYGPPWENVKLY